MRLAWENARSSIRHWKRMPARAFDTGREKKVGENEDIWPLRLIWCMKQTPPDWLVLHGSQRYKLGRIRNHCLKFTVNLWQFYSSQWELEPFCETINCIQRVLTILTVRLLINQLLSAVSTKHRGYVSKELKIRPLQDRRVRMRSVTHLQYSWWWARKTFSFRESLNSLPLVNSFSIFIKGDLLQHGGIGWPLIKGLCVELVCFLDILK